MSRVLLLGVHTLLSRRLGGEGCGLSRVTGDRGSFHGSYVTGTSFITVPSRLRL